MWPLSQVFIIPYFIAKLLIRAPTTLNSFVLLDNIISLYSNPSLGILISWFLICEKIIVCI